MIYSSTVERTKPAAQPNGHVIESLEVQSLGPSAWVISLTPFACGTGLELLQIADGNIVRENASSDYAIYRLANNISTVKVSRVHSATPPIGGTFVISFQGQLVKGIVIHLK